MVALFCTRNGDDLYNNKYVVYWLPFFFPFLLFFFIFFLNREPRGITLDKILQFERNHVGSLTSLARPTLSLCYFLHFHLRLHLRPHLSSFSSPPPPPPFFFFISSSLAAQYFRRSFLYFIICDTPTRVYIRFFFFIH